MSVQEAGPDNSFALSSVLTGTEQHHVLERAIAIILMGTYRMLFPEQGGMGWMVALRLDHEVNPAELRHSMHLLNVGCCGYKTDVTYCPPSNIGDILKNPDITGLVVVDMTTSLNIANPNLPKDIQTALLRRVDVPTKSDDGTSIIRKTMVANGKDDLRERCRFIFIVNDDPANLAPTDCEDSKDRPWLKAFREEVLTVKWPAKNEIDEGGSALIIRTTKGEARLMRPRKRKNRSGKRKSLPGGRPCIPPPAMA